SWLSQRAPGPESNSYRRHPAGSSSCTVHQVVLTATGAVRSMTRNLWKSDANETSRNGEKGEVRWGEEQGQCFLSPILPSSNPPHGDYRHLNNRTQWICQRLRGCEVLLVPSRCCPLGQVDPFGNGS